MAPESSARGSSQPDQEPGRAGSDRTSTRIALAIALAPFPIALLISWALGSPPWRPRPPKGPNPIWDAPRTPDFRRPGSGHPPPW